MKKIIIAFLGLLCSKTLGKGHVCSEDELVRELREDLEDNGKKIKERAVGLFAAQCGHERSDGDRTKTRGEVGL